MANYLLSNLNIDIISEEIGEFLNKCKVDRKDAMRIKLVAEETLLNYQEQFGEEQVVVFECGKRFGRPRVELRFPSARFNPYEKVEVTEEDSSVLQSILVNMGIAPTYQYKAGNNIVIFTPKRKPVSQMMQLAISILSAIGLGSLCLMLPVGLRLALANKIIGPIFGTFMGLLSAIAGPMIFFSVAWGIYSIGDTATLGKIGKRMISRFLFMTFGVTTVAGVLMLFFFPVTLEGGASFDIEELLKIVLGMVPNNFFVPFVEGNPLQIIFVAVCIGLSMLILANKTTVAASMMEQSNYIVQLMMETISKFVPVFVFGSIFNMFLNDNFSALMKAYKVLPITLAGLAIVIAFYLFLVSVHKKISPSLLIKKLFPTFVIAVSTASSAAAFATNVETCEKKLGIDKRIVNFGVPLGQIVFMLGGAIMFIAAALCMAEIYGVAISPVWMMTALIISAVLAIAAPPIPGGALTCYTMLFVQLNIPSEAIPIIIALNVITEFFGTAVNLFCLQLDLVELAGDLNMLDYEKLRKPMK